VSSKTRLLVIAFLALSPLLAQQYIISTYAGGAPPPTPVAGVQASIGGPQAVAVDSAGNVYFTSDNCVLKLDSTGTLTRVAGTSRLGYSGDGGQATSAQFANPTGVAVDAAGDLYIADSGNSRVRKVSPSGVISTAAGNGFSGSSGDGGQATAAQLSEPLGVAVDAAGNLYIADSGSERVRRVSSSGVITTVAGNGTAGFSGDGGPAINAQLHLVGFAGVAVDAAGNLYVADSGNERVRKVSPAGTITTVAGNGTVGHSGDGGLATGAQLNFPAAVAVDAAGNVYIADDDNQRIRKVSASGTIITVAGGGQGAGDGGAATSAALVNPDGVAVDASGNLYIADDGSYRVRKVSAAGIITTAAGDGSFSFSGDGGPAVAAQFDGPWGVAVDAGGNLFIADTDGDRIRMVSPEGIVTTVAGDGSSGFSGDGEPATSAQLSRPQGVAVDAGGNLYVADTGNSRIRKVSASGTITTVAGAGSSGFSGDGGPATSAQLDGPQGLAVDQGGNLYIADTANHRIRKVTPSGIITTVAGDGISGFSGQGDGGPATKASLVYPAGVAVDTSGSLYIADPWDFRIRKVSPSGTITTVAGSSGGYSGDGGPATSAKLFYPQAVAIDASGNLYIADASNARIRKVTPQDTITTIAGSGFFAYYGDGGPATIAALDLPTGLAINAGGQVFIAENVNNAIRLLTPSAAACSYSVSTTSLRPPAAGQSVTVAVTAGADCAWTVSYLPNWITVSGPASGSGSATVTLVVASNAGAGRSATVSVAGIAVDVTQVSGVLSIGAHGVVNSASYSPAVAAGSIASIFGNFLLPVPTSGSGSPVPTVLSGLSFQTGGFPTPLFYANASQVNAQIPWELANQTQSTIVAEGSGQITSPTALTLAVYAPGIFTTNSAGTGQGAILDSGNRLVDSTNPATPGATVLQIFCTGLGPVTNQPATGAPAPFSPLAETTTKPTVTIGGVAATVDFSGLVPGYVGLYQVNAHVPQGSATGSAAPVVIVIGGVPSNAVTIAVK
jgi:uncharacterized protein (TIGR03437 family)